MIFMKLMDTSIVGSFKLLLKFVCNLIKFMYLSKQTQYCHFIGSGIYLGGHKLSYELNYICNGFFGPFMGFYN